MQSKCNKWHRKNCDMEEKRSESLPVKLSVVLLCMIGWKVGHIRFVTSHKLRRIFRKSPQTESKFKTFPMSKEGEQTVAERSWRVNYSWQSNFKSTCTSFPFTCKQESQQWSHILEDDSVGKKPQSKQSQNLPQWDGPCKYKTRFSYSTQ